MSERPNTLRNLSARLNGKKKPIAAGTAVIGLGGAITLLQWIGWSPESKEAHAADVAQVRTEIERVDVKADKTAADMDALRQEVRVQTGVLLEIRDAVVKRRR